MLQIIRPGAVADVVVIGSGAGGGTVTKVLTDLGVNVTLLEAGPMLNPATDFKEHVWPYQVAHAACCYHAAHQWPARVPLLRAMRPRMRHGVKLFLQSSADFSSAKDWTSPADPQRHGAGVDHR
jgi:choline dehydrogenase-like flavoprotein